jgi:UPF0271 protein
MDGLVLNCDLGEGETPEQTESLMRCIGAANIACGGHAGNPGSLRRCLELCNRYGVRPGAHPGMAADFGRGTAEGLLPGAFTALLEQQLTSFDAALAETGQTLHHVKLHGGLYHAVEKDAGLAAACLAVLKKRAVAPAVFCLAGGSFAIRAREAGLDVWEEAFADRAYAGDGTLLPRSHSGALLTDPYLILARLELLIKKGEILTHDGTFLPCAARTLCVHGDTPGVLELFRVLAEALPPDN